MSFTREKYLVDGYALSASLAELINVRLYQTKRYVTHNCSSISSESLLSTSNPCGSDSFREDYRFLPVLVIGSESSFCEWCSCQLFFMTVFHFSMVVFVCICGVLELANGAKHTQSLLYSTRCFDLAGRLNISSRLHLQTNYGNMNFMIE